MRTNRRAQTLGSTKCIPVPVVSYSNIPISNAAHPRRKTSSHQLYSYSFK